MICVCVIVLGLTSRAIEGIPLYLGDMLYSVLVFFLLKTLSPDRHGLQIGIAAFFICLLIEMSQLSDAAWLEQLRSHHLGRLVLGQGFLWADILAYAVGVCIAGWMNGRIVRMRV